MADFGKMLTELQQERRSLDQAIQVIGKLVRRVTARNTRRPRRALSARARRRIAAAQRARWAKWKSNAFDRDANAFPSPRSWEFVSPILESKPDASIEHEWFAGAVGSGAATEFSGFLRMFRELPNIDAILLNPAAEPVPENAANNGGAEERKVCVLPRCTGYRGKCETPRFREQEISQMTLWPELSETYSRSYPVVQIRG